MEKLVHSLPFVVLTIYTSFKKGKVKNGHVRNEKRQCVVTTGRCCTLRETNMEPAKAAENVNRSQPKGHQVTHLRSKCLISDGSRSSIFRGHISSSVQRKLPLLFMCIFFFLRLYVVS